MLIGVSMRLDRAREEFSFHVAITANISIIFFPMQAFGRNQKEIEKMAFIP
jgi:hypothetical protein